MIDSSTTAIIGQIQICFFKNTPVREIERPTLDVAHVICAARHVALGREATIGLKFIVVQRRCPSAKISASHSIIPNPRVLLQEVTKHGRTSFNPRHFLGPSFRATI
jgi:hypothetical protein